MPSWHTCRSTQDSGESFHSFPINVSPQFSRTLPDFTVILILHSAPVCDMRTLSVDRYDNLHQACDGHAAQEGNVTALSSLAHNNAVIIEVLRFIVCRCRDCRQLQQQHQANRAAGAFEHLRPCRQHETLRRMERLLVQALRQRGEKYPQQVAAAMASTSIPQMAMAVHQAEAGAMHHTSSSLVQFAQCATFSKSLRVLVWL